MIRERLHTSPLVTKALEERPDLQSDPAALLRYLEEKGLVEDIFESLESGLQRQRPPVSQSRGPPRTELHTAPAALDGGCTSSGVGGGAEVPAVVGGAAVLGRGTSTCQLVLRLGESRAFLDFLDEYEAEGRELRWHIAFGRQRFRGHAVPATVDPRFDETLFFELPDGGSRTSMLTHAVPLHLILLCRGSPAGCSEDPWDAGAGTVLCSHSLEWRHCLSAAGPQKLIVELQGVGRRRQLSVGVLHGDIELRLVGSLGGMLSESGVTAQVHAEEQRRTDTMRLVFESLDRWWASYHELYRARNVRLFAQTEGSLFLPVTSFVVPLEAGRALDSPCHALRWVSLLGTEPATVVSEGVVTEPRWHTFPAIWAKGRATFEEKALLLTSLLLGFSLDAWCCLGTDVSGLPHAWVVIRSRGDASLPADVVCWDPKLGARIPADDPRYLSTYTSVDTLFNHRYLFVCHSSSVARTVFDLRDTRCWLTVPLDPSATSGARFSDAASPASLRLYSSRHNSPFADLRPRCWGLPVESETIEESIEHRLAGILQAHREAAGLSTRFDDHLSQLLQVALVNCELERATGVAGSSTFEDIMRRYCGAEEVLQAVPVQFNHLKVSQYWPMLSDRPTVRTLLAAPAASTAFALRARVVPYPEGVVAVWVLLAAVGRSA